MKLLVRAYSRLSFSRGKQSTFRNSTKTVLTQNDIWETSAEIRPYWWPVTTKIWVVLLIGWTFISTSQFKINGLRVRITKSQDSNLAGEVQQPFKTFKTRSREISFSVRARSPSRLSSSQKFASQKTVQVKSYEMNYSESNKCIWLSLCRTVQAIIFPDSTGWNGTSWLQIFAWIDATKRKMS